MSPPAVPSLPPSWNVVSEQSTPPPLILSKSPYSCIPLPTIDRRSLRHHDTPAHEQRLSSTHTNPLAPQTPPTINYDMSPYRCVPLPPQTDTNIEVTVNPVLELSMEPPIIFDLSLPPSAITVSPRYQRCLFEPATQPTLPSLTLITPLLPWSITVHRSSINPAHITVADVLGNIHSSVHIEVTEAEFKHLESSPLMQTRNWGHNDQVFQVRRVYRRDMKRIDFLERTRFMGLSKSSMGCDTWVLNVG